MKLKVLLATLVFASMVSSMETLANTNDIIHEKIEEAFIPLDVPMSLEMQKYIEHIATQNGVEFTLAMAVIFHESNYTEKIISKSNDYGYMQINVCAHNYLRNELGVTDFLNGYDNVKAGTYLLGDYMSKYKDYHAALMCYNMGEYGAISSFKNGKYSSSYSRTIVATKEKYDIELFNRRCELEVEIEREIAELEKKKEEVKSDNKNSEREVTETICTLPDIKKMSEQWRTNGLENTWEELVERLKGDEENELLYFGFALIPSADNEIWKEFRWKTISEPSGNAQFFEGEME